MRSLVRKLRSVVFIYIINILEPNMAYHWKKGNIINVLTTFMLYHYYTFEMNIKEFIYLRS